MRAFSWCPLSPARTAQACPYLCCGDSLKSIPRSFRLRNSAVRQTWLSETNSFSQTSRNAVATLAETAKARISRVLSFGYRAIWLSSSFARAVVLGLLNATPSIAPFSHGRLARLIHIAVAWPSRRACRQSRLLSGTGDWNDVSARCQLYALSCQSIYSRR